MRVTIDLDDDLMAEAMEITGLSTAEATVERALRELVRIYRQRRALEELRGIGWEGNLDEIRDGWGKDDV
ncbi:MULTISPECIES: type II toxin-antitoxin system VapB family antitoxin [unclassified Rhizobium]|uniref:type II toxin-antitoxin system VapB family antitoxin n=1 Tax=unclassified Rhizobium TaxID=2613769 RepID=UPI002478E340|nr:MULTISPECIES: type II toxin-antitoxin system VapB family antitoxin [unclassified Rhizobium]MDH7800308.1 Arc/MetJ family transcription regulator [Rhizobium sp. AN70]